MLWLLEDLSLPYEIRHNARNASTRLAPPEWQAVHPLGKLPVVETDGLKLIESGAIVDCLMIRNVVLLSGDEHLSCHARITLRDTQGHQVMVHSVHSSALYAPYPFANGVAALLADAETFQFDAPAVAPDVRFSCQVHTVFAPPGDGFTTLKVTQDNGGWWLRLRYHGAAGVKADGEPAPLRLTNPAPAGAAQAELQGRNGALRTSS